MNHYVVDASVAAKWFFEETHTREAVSLLHPRNFLYAPDFFLIEMDNLLCKRIRRRELNEKESEAVRTALRVFPVQYYPFSDLMDPAYRIAIKTNRSLYDCLYIALAILHKNQMVTADRKLYESMAAGPFGIHLQWIGDFPAAKE